jgi:hypothetical protein
MPVSKEKGPLENAGMCLISGSKVKKGVSTCPIVALQVTNPANGKVEKNYAMLDGGAEFAIIDHSLAQRLGVRTDKEKITVTTLESTVNKKQQVCYATLSNFDQTYILDISKFMLAESLPTTNCAVPRNKDLLDYAHLNGVQVIKLPKKERVSLIIGTNEPSAHVPSEVRKG